MHAILSLLLALGLGADMPREVNFPTADGGTVYADLYGESSHGVVLAHGKIFDKASWRPLATRLQAEGMMPLAIDFRGYGESKAGEQEGALWQDVLGAVRYMHAEGAEEVSVVGGSMGGGAAARAAVEAVPGEIDRLLLLSPVPIAKPEKMKAGSILFVVSGGERLRETVQGQAERAQQPSRLMVLDGDAHAQHIFNTGMGPKLTERIVEFLNSEIPAESDEDSDS